jgi:anti-sigma factor RsiW
MSCEKMESRILSFIDGRLKEGERLEVEKHLASCVSCQLRVEEFRAVSGLLDELPMIEPSPAFDARVHALVAAEPVKQRNWWAWMHVSPRIAFAASMLLVAALWMGFYPASHVPPPFVNSQVADEQMMQDLPVLEDHDVLSNFEPLKELPAPVQAEPASDTQQPM